jgi:hypothetical protein
MSEFLNLAVAAHGGLDDGQAKDRAFEASKVLRWGQSLACYLRSPAQPRHHQVSVTPVSATNVL